MAAPLRIVRRPKGQPRRALTAASQPVVDVMKTFKATMPGVNENDWQNEAWDMLCVGELRYYVGWRASSCSRVRLVASDIDPETGMPTGSTENRGVIDIVNQIAGGPLGQAQFVKRCAECLTMVGEVWATILIRPNPDPRKPAQQLWLALTRDEITKKGQAVEIELPTGEKHTFNPAVDSMFRIWNPHPRRAKDADSPVRGCLAPLHEIVRTTKTIANASKSRLIGNGIVFVPQEMSLPANAAPVPRPINTGSDSDDELVPEVTGIAAVEQIQQLLWKVAEVAYDDEDSMAALIPMFAAVPAELIDKIQHLKFENTVTEVAIKTRNDAIARLAMGLDVAPERLLGLGNSSNHWSAWLIEDSDVQMHIAPVMETICQAVNQCVLKFVLERAGFNPDEYILWYDTGRLTADPDKSVDATNAFDRGVINAEAYRDYLGLGGDDGYDLINGGLDEWQRWAADRIAQNPAWLPMLAKVFPPLQGIEFQAPAALPPGDTPPTQDNPQQEPQTEDQAPGDQPMPAARGRNQVQLAFVDLLVHRALELAGKRRRTHADHPRLRNVPMHETHRYMRPVSEREVEKYIAGWDSYLEAVEDDTLRLIGLEREEVRAAVRRAVVAKLTAPVVDG